MKKLTAEQIEEYEDHMFHALDVNGLIGLGWDYDWHNKKRAMGTCSYREKRIYLSTFLIPLYEFGEVIDTILHEVAHALAGTHDNEYGHGKKWKQWARKLGATPRAKCIVNIDKNLIDFKWYLMYGDEMIRGYHRKPTGVIRSLSTRYLINRKAESFGKLTVIPAMAYKRI